MDLEDLEKQGLIRGYNDYYLVRSELVKDFIRADRDYSNGEITYFDFLKMKQDLYYLRSFRPYLYWGNPKNGQDE